MANILRGSQWLTTHEQALNQSLTDVTLAKGVTQIARTNGQRAYAQILVTTRQGSCVFSVLTDESGANVTLMSKTKGCPVERVSIIRDGDKYSVCVQLVEQTTASVFIANTFPHLWVAAAYSTPPESADVVAASSTEATFVCDTLAVKAALIGELFDARKAKCVGVDADSVGGVPVDRVVTRSSLTPLSPSDITVLIPIDIQAALQYNEFVRGCSVLTDVRVGLVIPTMEAVHLALLVRECHKRGIGVLCDVGSRDIVSDRVYRSLLSSGVDGLVFHLTHENTVSPAFDQYSRAGMLRVVDASSAENIPQWARQATVTIVADRRGSSPDACYARAAMGSGAQATGFIVTTEEIDVVLRRLVALGRTFIITPDKRATFIKWDRKIVRVVDQLIEGIHQSSLYRFPSQPTPQEAQ